eukprot:1195489-Prorocentrum_minimum.AAC.18
MPHLRNRKGAHSILVFTGGSMTRKMKTMGGGGGKSHQNIPPSHPFDDPLGGPDPPPATHLPPSSFKVAGESAHGTYRTLPADRTRSIVYGTPTTKCDPHCYVTPPPKQCPEGSRHSLCRARGAAQENKRQPSAVIPREALLHAPYHLIPDPPCLVSGRPRDARSRPLTTRHAAPYDPPYGIAPAGSLAALAHGRLVLLVGVRAALLAGRRRRLGLGAGQVLRCGDGARHGGDAVDELRAENHVRCHVTPPPARPSQLNMFIRIKRRAK